MNESCENSARQQIIYEVLNAVTHGVSFVVAIVLSTCSSARHCTRQHQIPPLSVQLFKYNGAFIVSGIHSAALLCLYQSQTDLSNIDHSNISF